jgi:glycosyltransferase involved in cell wall biosynthesis
LRDLAGPTTEFLGFQQPSAVKDHLRRCRAFIMPGLEDFGMTAVEAQAAGRPVIAFDGGGAQESVRDGVTGVLFGQQTVDGLHKAMTRLDALKVRPEACLENASRFDTSRFETGILKAVDQALRIRRG